jgi:hypothetical protein
MNKSRDILAGLEALANEAEAEVSASRTAHALALQQIGRTGRERLNWLVTSFVYTDLTLIDTAQVRRLYHQLCELVNVATSDRWIVPSRPDDVQRMTVSRASDRVAWRSLTKDAQLKLQVTLRRLKANEKRVVTISEEENVSVDEVRLAQRRAREIVELFATDQPGPRWNLYTLFTEEPLGAPGQSLKIGVDLTIECATRGEPARFDVVQVCAATLPDAIPVAILTLLGQIAPTALRRCPGVPPASSCGRVFVVDRRQKYCGPHQDVARRYRNQRAQATHRKNRAAKKKNKRRKTR